MIVLAFPAALEGSSRLFTSLARKGFWVQHGMSCITLAKSTLTPVAISDPGPRFRRCVLLAPRCSVSPASLHSGSSAASRRARPVPVPGGRARPAARDRPCIGSGRVGVFVLSVFSAGRTELRDRGCAGRDSCSRLKITARSALSPELMARVETPTSSLLSQWSASQTRLHGSAVKSPCTSSSCTLVLTPTVWSSTKE